MPGLLRTGAAAGDDNVALHTTERAQDRKLARLDESAQQAVRSATALCCWLVGCLELVVSCGPSTAEPQREAFHKLAPVSELSPELRQLSPNIQEAYRFALANREILAKIPCCCGCSNVGHMDNYMCYVQSASAGGQVVLDYHAAV